jgi:hypothetical protein
MQGKHVNWLFPELRTSPVFVSRIFTLQLLDIVYADFSFSER